MKAAELASLDDAHPIFVCEGTAEEVIVRKLLAADALIFDAGDVVGVSRTRTAMGIQERYLNLDFDWPVCIVRLLDSRKERFRLGNLYRDRFEVLNVYTHPEIEVLAIIREDSWNSWRKSGLKPSDYCKQELRMPSIKSACFLEEYWTSEAIADAAAEYKRLSRLAKDELCLADIIKQ